MNRVVRECPWLNSVMNGWGEPCARYQSADRRCTSAGGERARVISMSDLSRVRKLWRPVDGQRVFPAGSETRDAMASVGSGWTDAEYRGFVWCSIRGKATLCMGPARGFRSEISVLHPDGRDIFVAPKGPRAPSRRRARGTLTAWNRMPKIQTRRTPSPWGDIDCCASSVGVQWERSGRPPHPSWITR